MIIDILTLFPEMFSGLKQSIIKRAVDNNLVEINIHDFREYTKNKNKRVDDYSYGGGAGMIIGLQPIVDCLRSIDGYQNAKKIITTPVGKVYHQNLAKELSKESHIIIICGHYEGIDDRINDYVDERICIGDYILTGGEIAAMAISDSIIRLIPNALGNNESAEEESFDEALLEYPQFTRPEIYEEKKVPEVLISGNHEKIRQYRRFMSLKNTYQYRKELLDRASLSKEDMYFLEKIKVGENL